LQVCSWFAVGLHVGLRTGLWGCLQGGLRWFVASNQRLRPVCGLRALTYTPKRKPKLTKCITKRLVLLKTPYIGDQIQVDFRLKLAQTAYPNLRAILVPTFCGTSLQSFGLFVYYCHVHITVLIQILIYLASKHKKQE